MISLLLTLILLVPTYCGFAEGKPLASILCIVLILGIWFMHIVAVDDAKAYVNRTRYWANGGPDGQRVCSNRRAVTVREKRVRIVPDEPARHTEPQRKMSQEEWEEALQKAAAQSEAKRKERIEKAQNAGHEGVMGGYYRK